MQVHRLSFFVDGKDILASLRPFPWFYEVMRLASKSNGPGQQILEEAIPVRVPCACPASLLHRGFNSAVVDLWSKTTLYHHKRSHST